MFVIMRILTVEQSPISLRSMKRRHGSYPAPEVRIFRITTAAETAPHSPAQDSSAPGLDRELTTCSTERFARMSIREKHRCFQRQAYEIKQLRRKLRKSGEKERKMAEREMLSAQATIKAAGGFDLEDQRHLLDNLVKAINSGRLSPGSLAYSRICTMVRSKLSIATESRGAGQISFPERTVGISQKECGEFRLLPHNESIFRALVGEGRPEARRQDVDSETSRYLVTQGEIIKGLGYGQFLSSMDKQKEKRAGFGLSRRGDYSWNLS